MIELNSDNLIVKIKKHGAELTSVVDKKSGYEYLWQGDSEYWGRQAPVLFPIIGTLKNKQMTYNGKVYEMGRHGFARDCDFIVQSQSESSVSLNLKSNAKTLSVYPFEFSLQITYILFESQITVSYEILNESRNENLYYSVGGHPAFNVSQKELPNGKLEFDKVSYSFEPAGKYYQIPLNKDGLANINRGSYQATDNIALTHNSFKEDALIYQLSPNTEIILKDGVENVEIRLKPRGMDYVGIWSTYPKRAGFVSLEPWAGLADLVDSEGDFTQKHGIIKAKPFEIKTHDYTIEFNKN